MLICLLTVLLESRYTEYQYIEKHVAEIVTVVTPVSLNPFAWPEFPHPSATTYLQFSPY